MLPNEFEGQKYRLSDNWFQFLKPDEFSNRPIKYLEIGCCAGANIISVAETYGKHDDSELHGIDPWIQYSEYSESGNRDYEDVFEIYNRNIGKAGDEVKNKITTHRGFSNEMVPDMQDDYFDIIYIDGNHAPEFVMEDAVLSFRKLKKGGFMIFDDYGWRGEDGPMFGIDGFTRAYNKRIERLGKHKTQVFCRKIS